MSVLPASRRRSAVPSPRATGVVPALLAETMEDGSVRCNACAMRCLVRPGRAGICGVRENRDGILVSTVYGRAVAVGIDPIEKKPLFHVAPGALAYSIATVGCPFHCDFCQNWEIAQAPRLGLDLPTRHLPPSKVVDEALTAGARAIAYTYVEPTVFLEYALDTSREAHEAGLLNLFVTDGYATPEAIDLLRPVLDAANVDLKSFDDAFYRKRCGARLAPVLDALRAYRAAGIWVEVTTLVIPGLNDDDGELRALAGWIAAEMGAETPWHVSRFFPAHELRDVPPTPLETLRRAADIGHEAGLAHVYVGNAPELGLEDTLCASCGRLLLERRGYRVFDRLGPGGTCPGCGHALAGRDLDHDGRVPCG